MQVLTYTNVGRNVCACVCAKNLQIDKSFRRLRTLCLLPELTFFATLMYYTRRLRSVRLDCSTWGRLYLYIYYNILYDINCIYLSGIPKLSICSQTPRAAGTCCRTMITASVTLCCLNVEQ